MHYRDRTRAGVVLAEHLATRGVDEGVVFGLARGGVEVGAAVADGLGLPLEVLVVRKLGVPWQPELGMGAIAERGVRVLNHDLIRRAGISEEEIDAVERAERTELDRRVRMYRGERVSHDPAGTTAVIVDDGLATGFTALAAVESMRVAEAARVVVAVPVGAADTVMRLEAAADLVVCPLVPASFMAVGQWYDDFTQTSDRRVLELLEAAIG
jgi:putative phosphoribosyl transferase